MSTKDKYTLMTTAPIPRLIGSLAVPTIISMLVTSFYVMADTYFVGQINTQSTAAVGISFSVMAIIQAFGFFFGHGSGNYISRKLGAKDYESAEKMAKGQNMEMSNILNEKTEVDELVNAFNLMTRELNQKLTEVNRQKKQIETILLQMTLVICFI